MFKWDHKIFFEINKPLHLTWDFLCTPSNWPSWNDSIESCSLKGEFKAGARINMKPKNSLFSISVNVAEVQLHQQYKTVMQTLFFKQENMTVFQEISSDRTLVLFETSVTSIFTPLLKNHYFKRTESSYAKCQEILKEK